MNDFNEIAMLLLIVVPLAGSLSMMFMPGGQTKETWYFAIFIAAISLCLSLVVFGNYDYNAGGFQYVASYEWLPGPLDISLSLGLDGISAPMVLLNGLVLFGGVLVSQTVHYRAREFFVLLFALAAGVYGVFVAQDLFFLFFFYELAVLPMYLLIGVWAAALILARSCAPKNMVP